MIFSLPELAQQVLLPSATVDKHLAYIEWFTPFTQHPLSNHSMYPISRVVQDGQRISSIIPLSKILGSVHLFPKFGSTAPRNWSSSNVLDQCKTFFVNPHSNRYIFVTVG